MNEITQSDRARLLVLSFAIAFAAVGFPAAVAIAVSGAL